MNKVPDKWYCIDSWFIEELSTKLKYFREHHDGQPMEYIGDWDEELDKMLNYLETMKHHQFDDRKVAKEAADKFFPMFVKYFWDLWD